MVTFHLSMSDIGVFLAILLRLSVVLFMTPVYSSSQIPNSLKAGFTLAMAAMLYPMLHVSVRPLNFEPAELLAITVGEVIFGMILALSISLMLGAVQFAGELISFQMGFGYAQVVDPLNGTQISIVSRLFQMLALTIFFTVGGHHLMLRAIVESFRTIPVGGFLLSPTTFVGTVALSKQLFIIAIKIAAPVMLVLLLTHVSLGLIGKFAPQMNLMTSSFPVTILIGFLFTALTFEIWGEVVADLVANTIHSIHGLMR